jgi:hypothetical protein
VKKGSYPESKVSFVLLKVRVLVWLNPYTDGIIKIYNVQTLIFGYVKKISF